MKKGLLCGVLAAGFMLLLAIQFPLFVSASAAQKTEIRLEARPLSTEVFEGQRLEMILSFKGLPKPAACFDMQIDFDAKRFEFKKAVPLGSMGTGEIHYNTSGSTTYLLYSDKEGGKSPIRDGDAVSLTYVVKEGATAGQANFTFQCATIGDSRAQMLGLASARCTVMVTPPPSGDASLASLVPSTGRLVPGFASDRFSYSLEVNANVDKVSLKLKTAHPGATTKVNRERLNGKGKSTRLIVTVTAPDGSTQKYIITVLRRKDNKTADSEEENDTGQHTPPVQMADTNFADGERRSPLQTRSLSPYWLAGILLLFAAVPLFYHLLHQLIVHNKKETP